MKFKKKISGGGGGGVRLGEGSGCQSGCERRSDAFLKKKNIFFFGGGGGGASGWGSGWM